ncbi:hypothetical protein HOLleu_35204 [Holothuria leucospilota]|uniref:Uncharacterized protein n=1 Tax=Holothuria leucospilota TaxID=206669 RepID=A0A9Q0YPE7_HOLLE|nr:hypothetical protein HOLleu_35204 [Holothuria leucospilota]
MQKQQWTKRPSQDQQKWDRPVGPESVTRGPADSEPSGDKDPLSCDTDQDNSIQFSLGFDIAPDLSSFAMPFMEAEESDGNGGEKASQNSSGSGSPRGSTWNVDSSKMYSSPNSQLKTPVSYLCCT